MGLALLLSAAVSGCVAEDWTAEETTLLSGFVLTAPPADPTNAVADSPQAALLGQQFFFDTRFSGPLSIGGDATAGALGPVGASGRVACASCHDPSRGGSDHRSPGATSLAAAWTGRNAPTVYNAAFSPWMFWDGRKDSQWSQALGPVESAAEHNCSRLEVAHIIDRHYRPAYEAIFGSLPDLSDADRYPAVGKPGMAAWDAMAPADQMAVSRIFSNFGKAIAAYERRLTDTESPFDRYMRGDRALLSAAAIRGAKLFVGRAACNECHSGPALSDGRFHNDGVPQVGPTVPAVDRGRADGIPKVIADEFNAAGPFSDQPEGRRLAALAPGPADLGAFKTPTLRNCGKTAPYMHTGGFATLWDVVEFYRQAAGTDRSAGSRDPSIAPLRLSDDDVADLVAFLEALDGAPLEPALVTAPVLP